MPVASENPCQSYRLPPETENKQDLIESFAKCRETGILISIDGRKNYFTNIYQKFENFIPSDSVNSITGNLS